MCHFVYFCINVTNAFFFFFLNVQVKPSMSFFFFFFVNMVVFTQYQPLLKEWTWCVSGRGSLWAGFFFFLKAGWILLCCSPTVVGCSGRKVTVTINFTCMKSSWVLGFRLADLLADLMDCFCVH